VEDQAFLQRRERQYLDEIGIHSFECIDLFLLERQQREVRRRVAAFGVRERLDGVAPAIDERVAVDVVEGVFE
jgi:hypothetical protein